MSMVTDMVLIASIGEGEGIARMNAWCSASDHRKQQFARLDTDAAGGTKWFNNEIWAMAGNYFASEDLVVALPSFGWRDPHNVILVVESEHDDVVRVYRADGSTDG
jgi:hypothetical protein